MDKANITTSLKAALVKELRLEGVTPESIDDKAPLFGDEGLGLDSLDAVELVVLVEKHYKVVIADAEEAKQVFGSVAQLVDHIVQKRGAV